MVTRGLICEAGYKGQMFALVSDLPGNNWPQPQILSLIFCLENVTTMFNEVGFDAALVVVGLADEETLLV